MTATSSTRQAPETAPTATSMGHLSPREEQEHVVQARLVALARCLPMDAQRIAAQAAAWALAARVDGRRSQYEAMMDAFGLATAEGKALMRLAEALLRIPDHRNAWRLLRENLQDAPWRAPPGVRFSARMAAALLRFTVRLAVRREDRLGLFTASVVWAARFGVAKTADHFVVASTVPEALARMGRDPALSLCSIDCLGESARTTVQAQRYFDAYEAAIKRLAGQRSASLHLRHGISVKLTALEPRMGPRHRRTYSARLIPTIVRLARLAAAANIGLTIDAEEQDRLESTLDVLAALIGDPITRDWEGLGLAVQAYGARTLEVIEWLAARARGCGRRITVRLVKGAYWDGEIKRAQERGLDAFPVFTDKRATDVSYLVAAKHLFDRSDSIFPQFATHNAFTVAAVRSLAPSGAAFEFQRLHGMGEQLYRVASQASEFPRVRVYAPVGSRQDLLAYLIRRLLENGANSSSVRNFLDPAIPIEALVEDPVASLVERPSSAQSANRWLHRADLQEHAS